MSGMSVQSHESSVLSGTTEELFKIWNRTCVSRPQKRQELRQEAASFFRSLLESTQIEHGDKILQTKASHEASISLLIQELGPAFEGSNASRVCAVHCLMGTLQGTFSLQMTELLVNFFMQHAGPIVEEDAEEDFEEQLRDAAVEATGILFRLQPTDQFAEAIKLRLRMTQSVIERRCAQPELENSYVNTTTNFISGLSGLPRSRRSLCFRLFQAATESIDTIFKERGKLLIPLWKSEGKWDDMESDMTAFVKIAISCLYGESDPRCLVQLLELFHSLQTTFTALSKFPIVEMFDAISPYYPIQFTPPPNNVFGVTREGLSDALMRVMSCTLYDDKMNGEEKMLNLSLGLILEQILGQDGTIQSTTDEQLEAVHDLRSLLFSTTKDPNARLLQVEKATFLSNTLLVLHSHAAATASRGGADAFIAKKLADSCRSLACDLCFEFEMSHMDSLWNAFVVPVFEKRTALYTSLHDRIHVAYLAGLCSCKGERTLRYGLKFGLDPLLKALHAEDLEDEARASIVYGVAAYFSSGDVTVSFARENGNLLSPNPLSLYTEDALTSVCRYLNGNCVDSVFSAATTALEAAVLYGTIPSFRNTAEGIFHEVVDSIEAIFQKCTDHAFQHDHTLSNSLAGILGKAYGAPSTAPDAKIIQTQALTSFLRETIAPRIFSLLFAKETNDVGTVILVTASNVGASASVAIVREIFERLKKSMGSEGEERYLRSLTAILRGGSSTARPIAQELIPTIVSANVDDVVQSENKILFADCFAEAYTDEVLLEHLLGILRLSEQHIPVKNDRQYDSLSVVLPILSSAVSSFAKSKSISDDIATRVSSLLHGVCEAIASGKLDQPTVSSSLSLVMSMLAFYTFNSTSCPALSLLKRVVIPHLSEWKRNFVRQRSSVDVYLILTKLLSTIGVACAVRGKESLRTCDQILAYLISLCCRGRATIELEPDGSKENAKFELNLQQFADDNSLAVLCATLSSFAYIFFASSSDGLWKQRLEFTCLNAWSKEVEVSSGGAGLTVLGCHLICNCSLKRIGKSRFENLVVSSLNEATKLFESGAPEILVRASQRNVVLAAILKSISVDTDLFRGELSKIVPLILRLYLSDPGDGGVSGDTAGKLLSLQALCQIAHAFSTDPVVAAIKPAITSILGSAMNEESVLLRMAAVETRNAWFMI